MTQPIVEHDPDAQAVIYVRVPGWLKNKITAIAAENGMTVNTWAANVLQLATRNNPIPPPPARAPIPDATDTIRAYLTGERLLSPCGQPWPCRLDTEGTTTVAGLTYCTACGIRTS